MTGQRGSPWTLPLASEEAALDLVGGKGASLMRLATSGFPVPPGFLITTAAYRRFVAENDLQAVIDDSLARCRRQRSRLTRAGGDDYPAMRSHAASCRKRSPPRSSEAYAALGNPSPRSLFARRRPPRTCPDSRSPVSRRRSSMSAAIRRCSTPFAVLGRRSGRRGRSPIASRWASIRSGWPWPWSSRLWCRPKFPGCSSRRTRQQGIAASS